MLSCPKCCFENDPDALECKHCGIVFEKYPSYLENTIKRKQIEDKGAKKIRRRMLISFALFIFYVPAGGLIRTITGSDKISFIFVLIYFGFLAFFLFLWTFSVCPRCEKYFFYDWYSYRKCFKSHPFRTKCINCGFSIK